MGAVRRAATGGAALVVGLVAAGCTVTVAQSDVEDKITELVGEELGDVTVEDASCPDDLPGEEGEEMTCTATVDGEEMTLRVTVTSVDGTDVEFRIDPAE